MSFGLPSSLTSESPPRREDEEMLSSARKSIVVIGGGRGVSRRIVEAGIRESARVLAVARQEARLT